MIGGGLDQNIIQLFKSKFEERCIVLLIESYKQIIPKNSFSEFSENNITVRLVGIMKTNPTRLDLQISITREAYVDENEIYEGLKDANEALRIDIKFVTWNFNIEYEYYIEAKNLSEKDWLKQNDNVKVNAYNQRKRYIETGIENFITNKYPNGCLVGYVVQGDPDKIVMKINELLTNNKRGQEVLTKQVWLNFEYCYKSIHKGRMREVLNHYMISFN